VGSETASSSVPSTMIRMPFEASTGSPSTDKARQENRGLPARRLATRKGSTAEKNAIEENFGISRNPIG
jgi:hypothetical protein